MTFMKTVVRALLGAAVGLFAGGSASAQTQTVKIGVLTDMSGLYADVGGPGSVARRARWRSRISACAAKGMKVEIVTGDHQNKPDIGANIARQWFDVDKVDVIVDVPNSGVALAVNEVVKREEQGLHRSPARRPPI